MAAPSVTGHNLVDGVARNLELEIDFDCLLNEATVTGVNFVLSMTAGIGDVQETEIEYEAGDGVSTVKIRPVYVLDSLTTYRLTIMVGLQAADETPLAAIVRINFTTGEEYQQPADFPVPIDDQWREALGHRPGFYLASSTPADAAWGLPTNPDVDTIVTQITLVFSEAIDPDQWPADPADDWDSLPVRILVTAIDGDPRRTIPTPTPSVVEVSDDHKTVIITLSTAEGTVYNTKWDSTWEADTDTADITFGVNSLIRFTLLSTVINEAGSVTLGEDVELVWSTELFPKYSTVEMSFARISSLANILELSDRAVDYILFQESQWLASMLQARDEDALIGYPTRFLTAQQFVQCKSIWNLVTESITVMVTHGTTQDKQLGQFRVIKSYAATPRVLTLYIDKAEKCWHDALQVLLPVELFVKAIQGINSPGRRISLPNIMWMRRQLGSDAVPYNPWGVSSDLAPWNY